MRKVVFDIETRNIFQDVGSSDPAALDISVVCLYDYETGSYTSYLQEDFPKLWEILDKTDILITFNGDHFDIPLLNKYYQKDTGRDLLKLRSIDILRDIRNSYGRRMKLEQVAQGTFNLGKSGGGLDAVIWWRQGEIDKIIKYCIDDVKITKDVYEYALKNKKLFFKEGPFVKEIKLDTKQWEFEPEAKTQTLF